eukprot:TRINITY_DN30019_c0_g1_i1.p1 TRINITY_DN30019_c0_g1~~TRINITY_DN30019_c0_g1_i1.p1  ORF type:complete len:399 (-),score=40.06 TRINITY_DN30019_c0_g1_i1:96-1292(-)
MRSSASGETRQEQTSWLPPWLQKALSGWTVGNDAEDKDSTDSEEKSSQEHAGLGDDESQAHPESIPAAASDSEWETANSSTTQPTTGSKASAGSKASGSYGSQGIVHSANLGSEVEGGGRLHIFPRGEDSDISGSLDSQNLIIAKGAREMRVDIDPRQKMNILYRCEIFQAEFGPVELGCRLVARVRQAKALQTWMARSISRATAAPKDGKKYGPRLPFTQVFGVVDMLAPRTSSWTKVCVKGYFPDPPQRVLLHITRVHKIPKDKKKKAPNGATTPTGTPVSGVAMSNTSSSSSTPNASSGESRSSKSVGARSSGSGARQGIKSKAYKKAAQQPSPGGGTPPTRSAALRAFEGQVNGLGHSRKNCQPCWGFIKNRVCGELGCQLCHHPYHLSTCLSL